ncbi:MAG: autotransporter assembly complex protein TamA [Candidatus Latescibacteria bacterium]|nr:autotransporter assembly complex protein TamA [Candidatus Latescibacterota bacterium]
MNPLIHTVRRGLRSAILCAAALACVVPAAVWAAKVDCEVEGVDDKEILENILAVLSIVRDKDRDDLTPARIAQLHGRASTEIQRAVEPFGYYHAMVSASLEERDEDTFLARYRVQLGEPVRVRDVRVGVTGAGQNQPPFPDLVAAFPLRSGDVLDQRRYTQHKNAFVSAAADSGYLDARFTVSVIRIHRGDNIADIALTLDTGPQYRFGAVTFDSSAVDERVLRSYLTFRPGEPFRYHKLLAFQSALGGAPYFSRVEAIARKDTAVNHEVPIHVGLTMRRPRHYEVGVGYGTDTGPRLLLNVEFRRLNRTGHRYTGRINVSAVELSVNAEYVIPTLYPKVHTYTIGALVARLDPETYTTDRLAVGPTRSQPRLGWMESLTLAYEREEFTVGSDEGTTDLFIAGATYRRKRADDDISPTHGQRVDVSLRGSSEDVLSSQSFFSFTTLAKGVRSKGRFRLLARVEGGWTSTGTFRELPPTVRFFAGGDNSVRGYEYQSLGPKDASGQVIGGHLLLNSSVEVEIGVVGKFALAGFYDAGNAFASFDEGTMEQGAGGGLRFRSPVGPIRLDLAFALRHDDWRVHFTMGPDL